MEGTITISQDDRRFTNRNRIGFVFLFIFLTLHALGFSFGTIGVIWSKVLVGDFTRLDLIWAIGLTILAVPALVTVYSIAFISAFTEEPYARESVLLDNNSGSLILRSRHVIGLCRERSLSVGDIKDIRVTWTKDEDGKDIPKLELLANGKPVHPTITNPADAADLPAFAARLRAQLVALGWPGGPACGCPQGEAVPDRS